jgi:hypothetical protein
MVLQHDRQMERFVDLATILNTMQQLAHTDDMHAAVNYVVLLQRNCFQLTTHMPPVLARDLKLEELPEELTFASSSASSSSSSSSTSETNTTILRRPSRLLAVPFIWDSTHIARRQWYVRVFAERSRDCKQLPIGTSFPEDTFGSYLLELAKRHSSRHVERLWGTYIWWDVPMELEEARVAFDAAAWMMAVRHLDSHQPHGLRCSIRIGTKKGKYFQNIV